MIKKKAASRTRLRTKCIFVRFCTSRTFLYENRAVFKYLIYNVINAEKRVSARKHKIFPYF